MKRRKQNPPPPPVEAVALVRKDNGHAIVRLELPTSVLEKYAVSAEAPEVRAIVAAKLIEWVEGVQ